MKFILYFFKKRNSFFRICCSKNVNIALVGMDLMQKKFNLEKYLFWDYLKC